MQSLFADFSAVKELLPAISLVLSLTLALFYLRDRRRAAFDLESRYLESLLKWHALVVDVLIRLRTLRATQTSEARASDLANLSSLIEQGRFFFPNIDRNDNFGHEKPIAYRGYRNLALDFLVASYNLFHQPPSERCAADAAHLQRYFTSIVFEVVSPEKRLKAIRGYTDRYFVVQKAFDDFLEHKDGAIIEHIWRTP